MARHNYKRVGSLRAGFLYQDLVAIETLINFYEDRDLYKWVQLEAEDSEFRSIEDVVACTPSGLYELTQVKFTVDPDDSANQLSWKWLTEKKKGNKKSLLEKWAPTTLRHKEDGTLARAALKTDRVPDAAFRKCLRDGKVDYSMLAEEVKARVEEQVGSHDETISFFESFEFIHSLPRLNDLEDNLWQRIASDTDEGGWHKFRNRVQLWSTEKGQPVPDGKIRYIHLRQVFSIERSRPIPQDFRVPSDYSVPDERFDKAFLAKICNSDGVAVLWGPPGSGKSTYLSHFVARIDRKKVVCVRHHYFLSLTDRSVSRYHYHAIDQSLRHQLEEAVTDLDSSGRSLEDLLETVACQLRAEKRRLIVIIDGLDHVWRDQRGREDMEMLFDSLFPLPSNVSLVVGTQKIASAYLPKRLLKVLPTEHWTELPLMTQAAVHSWLRIQDKNGRLNLKTVGQQRKGRVFGAVARAFHKKTNGLPLHLIYSFEEIVNAGGAVAAEDVEALPACPTGDIRDYYQSLWDKVNAKAQSILHVLAGLEFGPPLIAMRECFGNSGESILAIASIEHLLDRREMEVRPFHGSLFAFVRDRPDHEVNFRTHASDVLSWLETCAPEYWRWAWLWITKAQLGNSSDLLNGPDREWAIRSLVEGYPIDQITAILDHAERVAFDVFDLPRLLSLRSLKERTIYGPTFQTNEWPLFREVGVSLSRDPDVETVLRAELHKAPVGLLPFIVGSSDENLRNQLAQDATDELIRRATQYDVEMDGYDRRSELAHAIAAVTAKTETENFSRVVALAKKNTHASNALIATYCRASLLASNFENVFAAGKYHASPRIDRDVLAALCLEGLAPSSIPKLRALTHPAIRCFALLKGGGAKRTRTKKDLSRLFGEDVGPDPTFAHETRFAVYEAFFSALAAGLVRGNAIGWSKIPKEAQATWLSQAVRALEQLAGYIAKQWHTSGRWPSLLETYEVFDLHPPTSSSSVERRSFNAVRLALRDAAVDLCTIAIGLDANALIDASELHAVSASPFWLDELWLEEFSERRLPLHSKEAARVIVQRAGAYFDSKIIEFNDRATGAVKLAMFATDNGLAHLARRELRRAIGCLLGYGWHKDLFALEVLMSLEFLAERDDFDARKSILDLSGEFEAITKYTDGDETEYAREHHYKAITKYFPERVSACYAHLIRNEDWRYAEVLATAIAESDQVESRVGLALLESYINPAEVRTMEAANWACRPYTKTALEIVNRKIGRTVETPPKNEDKSGTRRLDNGYEGVASPNTEPPPPEPVEFPPEKFNGYLSAIQNVSSFDYRRRLVKDWLKYWGATGRVKEAISEFEAAFSDSSFSGGFDSDLENALDTVFEIVLKTQGRSSAFPWLIRAHVNHWGWMRWYASDAEAQTRFREVAKHYLARWEEFIRKTAKPRFPVGATTNGIDVGRSRLVSFLVEVGQQRLARDYALEMARIFQEELKGQPIERPEWSK